MKIAVLGYGVVGSGVVELIHNNAKSIENNAGEPIDVKYIVDIREFPGSPYAKLFTKEFDKVLSDPEVETVVEVIGGIKPAYTFVKRSLENGKNVVTSNKELVATYGYDLLDCAKEHHVNFLFEASVGGGIPIIRPLSECFAANRIERIYGILNGTTNYILSNMVDHQFEFTTVLSQAQQKGYAEADPSADINGIDSGRKLCILSSMAFGNYIDPKNIRMEGISQFDCKDIPYIVSAGYTVKLIALAEKNADGIYATVSLYLLPQQHSLAQVKDAFNEIIVEGNAVGETRFFGYGAGKFPTASAVVADVIDCAKHRGHPNGIVWKIDDQNVLLDPSNIPSSFYIRLNGKTIADLSQKQLDALSIQKIIYKDNAVLVAITSAMCENEIYKKIQTFCQDHQLSLDAKYRVFSLGGK